MKKMFLFILMMVLITGFAFSEIIVSATGSYNEDQSYNLDPAVDLSLAIGDFTLSAGAAYSLPDQTLSWSAGLDFSKSFLSFGVDYSGNQNSILDCFSGTIGIDLGDWIDFYGGVSFAPMTEEFFTGADLGVNFTLNNFSAMLGYQIGSYVLNSVYEIPGAYFSASYSF